MDKLSNELFFLYVQCNQFVFVFFIRISIDFINLYEYVFELIRISGHWVKHYG